MVQTPRRARFENDLTIGPPDLQSRHQMDSRLLSQHLERAAQLLAQRLHQHAAPLAVELARPAQVPQRNGRRR
jgi:hypothetical protein